VAGRSTHSSSTNIVSNTHISVIHRPLHICLVFRSSGASPFFGPAVASGASWKVMPLVSHASTIGCRGRLKTLRKKTSRRQSMREAIMANSHETTSTSVPTCVPTQ